MDIILLIDLRAARQVHINLDFSSKKKIISNTAYHIRNMILVSWRERCTMPKHACRFAKYKITSPRVHDLPIQLHDVNAV